MTLDSKKEFLSLYLRIDAYYNIYEWKVYSVGDMFGQIGGVW